MLLALSVAMSACARASPTELTRPKREPSATLGADPGAFLPSVCLGHEDLRLWRRIDPKSSLETEAGARGSNCAWSVAMQDGVPVVYAVQGQGRALRSSASDGFGPPSAEQKGASGLKEGSPFRYIAESGIKSQTHHEGKLLEQVDLNTWVTMSIQRAVDNVSSRLQDGLAFLATVGSTAPFVGLFGTVWGIYHALTAIGIAGQASIDKVAGPVGEALIMTAFGLAVAVPAVLGYNWLIRRNKAAMDMVRSFGADLHAVLLSAPKVAAAPARA